jgi:hypothetical protein
VVDLDLVVLIGLLFLHEPMIVLLLALARVGSCESQRLSFVRLHAPASLSNSVDGPDVRVHVVYVLLSVMLRPACTLPNPNILVLFIAEPGRKPRSSEPPSSFDLRHPPLQSPQQHTEPAGRGFSKVRGASCVFLCVFLCVFF